MENMDRQKRPPAGEAQTHSRLGMEMVVNPSPDHGPGPAFLGPEETAAVRAIHTALPEYRETALVRLDALAEELGVRAVFVKDESTRFGLKAFKGLGGIYALYCAVCDQLGLRRDQVSFAQLQAPPLRERVERMVFATATDGNHGKGVVWAASKLGCSAHVYMPRGSSPLRAQAIRDAGRAEVLITDLTYDGAVRYAARMAEEKGWTLIQDTSWPGYEQIPRTIVQGYTTMAWEAAAQLDTAGERPTHVFLQAGVGAMAGGVLGYLRSRYAAAPLTAAIVEPREVACIFRSAQVHDGAPHEAVGSGVTIMAGLNCGEPCTVVWPILRDQADFYFSCPDWVAAHGMRLLHRAGVTSGESGAFTAGLASMLARAELADWKAALGLDENAVLLLFSTEGDTDPVAYKKIVDENAFPVPQI